MRSLLRRSFGIAAPRVSVRPAMPWPWRALVLAGLLAVAAGAGWLVVGVLHESGFAEREAAGHELARLQALSERQERELAALRMRAAQSEGQLKMEAAATADLARQVKALTFENAALKEDLAFFQTLMTGAGGREGTIAVNRFRLQPNGETGEYRFQLLLVQSGQRQKAFAGRLELLLDVQQGGRKTTVVFPSADDRDPREYLLDFRFFQRIEGSFKLPPGSAIHSAQVRVFESGSRTPKLVQAVNIP